jgi:hypothetical protein
MRETATARVSLEHDGIVVVRISDGARQDAPDALENLDAAVAVAEGRRRPLLVDIRRSLPVTAEARHIYSGRTLVAGFTALGLLVEASPLGLMMGNVYFRVARPGIPGRLFTDEARAVTWLKDHLDDR